MSETPAANLPVLIQMQGGEVARVLGWQQHLEVLTEQQQLQVGMMVQMYPGLDSEVAVDLLAEAAGHYGEELDRWFGEMIDQYTIETVYLAIDMMDHLGLRGRSEQGRSVNSATSRDAVQIESEKERFDLDLMLGIIEALKMCGHEPDGVVALGQCIDKLGNWEMAILLDPDHIEALMNGEADMDDIRRLVDAPTTNP